jgi:ribosomal protein S18 acetylase RimI-like enzyme
MSYAVRALGAPDVDAYWRIRLDALRLHPEAFASDYEDEIKLDHAKVVERFSPPGLTRFGGFVAERLVGTVTLGMGSGAKVKHKAHLFGMYVDGAHRGTGLARQLVEAVIRGARDAGAIVLNLSVTAGNAPAQGLYRQMGFVVYGVEPRAYQVGGRYYDSELMALDLDQSDRAP